MACQSQDEPVDMAKLEETFNKFKVQGAVNAAGMSNKNFAKCCKDCGVIDGKKCTTTDVDIAFNKHKVKGQQVIDFKVFTKILDELAVKRTGGDKNATYALVAGKEPGLKGITQTSKTGGVDHLTDTSQYTGSHAQRFDKDGKGLGLDGRADMAENNGYVGNYKGQGSYDKKVKK